MYFESTPQVRCAVEDDNMGKDRRMGVILVSRFADIPVKTSGLRDGFSGPGIQFNYDDVKTDQRNFWKFMRTILLAGKILRMCHTFMTCLVPPSALFLDASSPVFVS